MSEQRLRPGICGNRQLRGEGGDFGSVLENLQAVMHHHGGEQEEFDGEGNGIEMTRRRAGRLISQRQVDDSGHEQKRDSGPRNGFKGNSPSVQSRDANGWLQIMYRRSENDEKECNAAQP